ncbi:HEPN domain-containing protein [Compostibacter hankyongensis]|uniref:HEPN domain-containing protein n=1 Tax=Compostibacter hankyongensis TaxID=1007089 RepID=A0ABP8FLY1_9BACT
MTEYKREDYVNYRFQKSKETLREVDILIDNQYWNTAINRLYYACFYAVGAILVKKGIKTSSHSGVRQKFGELFVKEGKISKELAKHYSELFEKRHKGDYDDFYDFDRETVLRLLPPSRELIKQIGILIADDNAG